MALFARYRPFEEHAGQLYFNRAKSGPTYEITGAEKTMITLAMKKLRQRMYMVIGGFVLLLFVTVFLLPQILGLNSDLAFIVVAIMLGIGVFPFLVMVKLHLMHQKKIRGVLGERRAIPPESMKPAGPASAKAAAGATPGETPEFTAKQTRGMSTGKLATIFLLGIAIATVGAVMLFSGDDMEFRRQLIWWLNLVTGSLLAGLGIYGLIIKQKPPLSPLPTPRGGQSDRP